MMVVFTSLHKNMAVSQTASLFINKTLNLLLRETLGKVCHQNVKPFPTLPHLFAEIFFNRVSHKLVCFQQKEK